MPGRSSVCYSAGERDEIAAFSNVSSTELPLPARCRLSIFLVCSHVPPLALRKPNSCHSAQDAERQYQKIGRFDGAPHNRCPPNLLNYSRRRADQGSVSYPIT